MNISPSATQVFEITELHVGILESFPPKLDITVRGTVTTAGWTDPQLKPFTYVQAPPDGVYDFDFVATPPKGVAAQVMTPIRLKVVLPGAGVNGIRVHAAQNNKEVIFNPTGAQAA